MHPPGQCDSCGLVFPVTMIVGGEGAQISFANCLVGCPRCGSNAKILDGTYSFLGETVKLLSGPSSTIETLTKIAKAVSDSVAAGESAERTFDRVKEFAPWLANLAPIAKNQAVQFIWAALGVIAGYEYTQYRDSSSADQKRQDAVEVAREGAQRQQDEQAWRDFQDRMKHPLPKPTQSDHIKFPGFGFGI